ncbi:MAG: cadherin repeat domain-containing protein, partial [Pseudomonadota bacterium]
MAALGDGGFVVGMSGFAPSADDPDMGRSASFRIYGPDRAAEGPAVVVPGDLAGQDELRHLIATPDGGFAVLYVSEQLGGGGDDRTAGIRRYDATGSQIGAEATLALPEFGNVVGFSAYDDGRLAVITADFVNGDTLSVIDVTGTLILNNAETSSRISSIGPINQLVEGREGEVVLLSRSQGFSGADVRLIGFDGAGNETFDTLIFDDNQSGGVFAVARLSDGSYAVVEAASGDYTLVKVDADGVAGAPMALGTFGAAGGSLSGLAADGQGGFVVLISNFDTDAGQFKSLGVKVDASGNVEGSFPLSRDPSGGQREPAGAYIDDGDLIVSFVDSDPQTFRTTTQIQGFDPSGTTAGATPTDIVLTGAPVPIGQAGVEIGALSAVDADQTDGFVFSIVEGTAFEIEGDVLRYRAGVAGDPQFASTTEVTVRVVDNDSNIFDERFEITFEGDDGDGAGGDGGSGGGGDGSGGSDGSGGGDSSGDGGDVGGGGGGSSGGADGSGGGDGGGGGSGDSSGGGDGGGDEVGGGSGGGGGGSSGGSDGSGGNDGGGGGSDGTGSSDGIGSSDGSGSGGGGGSSDGDLGDGGDGGD